MQVNITSLIRRSGRERCPLQGEDLELAGWVSKCSSILPANVFPPRAAIVAPTAFVAFGMPRDMQGKAGSPRRTSQAAPHPGTNRALRRSTSEVRGDPVHSAWHGHRRLYAYMGPSRFRKTCFVSERPLPTQKALLRLRGFASIWKDQPRFGKTRFISERPAPV